MTEATGWRWVPPDYTPEMYEAFRKARPKNAVKTEDNGWKAPDVDWFRAQYHALLAAAPSVPEPSEDEVEQAAQEAVEKIIDDLTDRKGLKHQWDQIDEDIQEEIADGWREIIRAALSASAPPAAPADEQMAVLECYVAELDRAGIPDGCPIGTCPEQPARRSGILNAGHLRALARHRAQPSDCCKRTLERAAVDMENWPAPRKKTRYCKCGKPVVCVTIAAAAIRALKATEVVHE